MGDLMLELYGDIYRLGNGCKKAFCAVGRFFVNIFRKAFRAVCRFFIFIATFFKRVAVRYFNAIRYECKKFNAEVKRAVPVLKAEFREKPFKGIWRFIRYVFHTFRVHERFNRAVLSTVIPVVAAAVLFSFASELKSVIFALDVYVDGEMVGTVKDENAYKDAEKAAKHRFSTMGEEMAASVPEYKVTITNISQLSDTETVCNNIISAVSEKTVNACGIYVNDEFLCTVDSEDTFLRVKERIFNEFNSANETDQDDCKTEFADEVTTVIGLYPENDTLWSGKKLYEYMSGYSTNKITHVVKKDETVADILLEYSVSKEDLAESNPDADIENLSEGEKLIIIETEKNMSIKVTKTYVKVENVPFRTVSQYDNNMYVGTTMTVVPGSNGQDVVSYTDTFVDGKKTDSSKEILRYTASSPIDQLIKVGTLGVPVDDSGATVSPRLTKDQGGTFLWPAPDNCFWLSQQYKSYGHYGIDIVSSNRGSCKGRPIVSVADGIVVTAINSPSWGYYIRVDHGDGVVTGYAHAIAGSFKVKVGDYVRAGQELASIGTTGRSTGYHLHFEVYIDGVRVNPLPYVYSYNTGAAVK